MYKNALMSTYYNVEPLAQWPVSGLNLQMKLLNLYIKRAQTGSGGADPTTDVSGQS